MALVRNLSELDYHSDTTTLSASGAKVLLGKRPPAPDSEALAFGRLVHILLLEPHRLDREYVDLDPNIIGVKKDGTQASNPKNTDAWREAVFKAQQSGLTIIDAPTLAKAQAMAQAVMEHPEAGRLMAMATETEVSAYATHPTGAEVRARFDAIVPAERALVDVKTARDANPEVHHFDRVINGLMYHVSAANYLDVARANGLDVDKFIFIAVENEPTPGGEYRVAVMELHPDAIDKGRELMTLACERWLALGKRIDLPSYGDGRHVVDLPPWAYESDFEDMELGEVS
jgi:hypothetical protein